jgi:heme A synthase
MVSIGLLLSLLSGAVPVHYSNRLLTYPIVGTPAALAAAVFIDAKLKRHRQAALTLLALAFIQTGVGAGVLLSGLNFAATALHLAMALIMLIIIGCIWAGEAKGVLP